MVEYRKSSHAVYDIMYHVVWIAKYRYKILKGETGHRLRELIRQGCEARSIGINQGSIGKDHVHLLLSCPPTLAPCKIVQYLKGRSSHLIQEEFPELKKRYWGQHLWARGYFCATVGTVMSFTHEGLNPPALAGELFNLLYTVVVERLLRLRLRIKLVI